MADAGGIVDEATLGVSVEGGDPLDRHEQLVRLIGAALEAEPDEPVRALLAEAATIAEALESRSERLRLQADEVRRLEAEIVDLHERAELSAALSHLGLLATAPDPLVVLLSGVTRLAAAVLAEGEVGMTLLHRPQLEAKVASGPIAVLLDALQREAGEGPCFAAVERNEVVHTRSAEWPALAAPAAEAGIVEVVAVPLSTRDDPPVGALNVYGATPLSEREIEVLTDAAGQAAVAFDNARLFLAASKLARELTEAFESRGVIEQAKGLLMAREGCDAEGAILILKRASQRENVKLRDIARRMVDRATRT